MKSLNFVLVLIASFFLSNLSAQMNKSSIIAKDAVIEQVGSGFAFTEGPTVASDGRVFFTDQPNDRIHIWDEKKGVSLWLEGTGRSNGMYFNHKDQLVTCADEKTQLAYFDENKNLINLCDSFDGKHLNGPNDVWTTLTGGYYLLIHTIIAIGGLMVIKNYKMFVVFIIYHPMAKLLVLLMISKHLMD